MVTKRDFTDRFLKAIKPVPTGKRVIIWDAAVPGFGIRISEKSTAQNIGAFVLVSRFPGGRHPVARRIGDYPATSLADARTKARAWREDLTKGIDPAVKEEERRRAEQARRDDTFAAAFDQFAQRHLALLRTGKAVEQTIRRIVTPKWGDWPLSDVRRRHVIDLIDEIASETPIAANRVLAYLKTFFRWCVDRDKLETSPAESVKRPARETRRDRVLTDEEIRAIWKASGEMGPFGRAFRFMLATGQRRTEVGSITWREIDKARALWTLPRERAKADRSHEVPLSSLALSILEECPKLAGCGFVFSTGRAGKAREGEEKTACPLGGWSKAKARLDARILEAARNRANKIGDEVPKQIVEWHLHDLRRTAATHMAKLGVDRIVIAKVLNHADREITGVYDRFAYSEQKRRALDALGVELTRITADAQREANFDAPAAEA